MAPKANIIAHIHIFDEVGAVLIWHDPFDPGFCCCVDELSLGIWRGGCRHGDDQNVLILERVHNRSLIVVVNVCYGHPIWNLAATISTRDSRNLVLAPLDEMLHNVFAD